MDRDKRRQAVREWAGREWAVSAALANSNLVRSHRDCREAEERAREVPVVNLCKSAQGLAAAADPAALAVEEDFAAPVVPEEEECLGGAVAGWLARR